MYASANTNTHAKIIGRIAQTRFLTRQVDVKKTQTYDTLGHSCVFIVRTTVSSLFFVVTHGQPQGEAAIKPHSQIGTKM